MSGDPFDPFAALKRLARSLGWNSLTRCTQVVPSHQSNAGLVVVWYEATALRDSRRDGFLQINECPSGQQRQFAASVTALRFRLCSGWHVFTLSRGDKPLKTQLAALSALLHRAHFSSASRRASFRQLHPECTGYTWAKLRRNGMPFEIVDAEKGLTVRRS